MKRWEKRNPEYIFLSVGKTFSLGRKRSAHSSRNDSGGKVYSHEGGNNKFFFHSFAGESALARSEKEVFRTNALNYRGGRISNLEKGEGVENDILCGRKKGHNSRNFAGGRQLG